MLSGGLQDNGTWSIECSDMAGGFNAFSHKALESQIRGVLRDNNIGELTSDKNMIPRAEFWLVPSDYSVQKKVIKVMLPS